MNKVLRNILLGSFLIAPLTACQTVNQGIGMIGIGADKKYDMAYLKANLKIGTTTSEQVIKMFGKPSLIQEDRTGPGLFKYVEGESNTKTLVHSAMRSIGNLGGISDTSEAISKGKNRNLWIHFKNNKVSDFMVDQ